jgi:hypothetical protein
MARGTTSEFHQEMPPAKFAVAGTKPVLRRFSFKCSNLARGESMKDPVCIFEAGGVFRYGADGLRPRDREPCDRAGLIIELRRN